MLDPDIHVTRQAEDRRYDRDGTPSPFIRVEYYVGKHGPFVERFDKTDDWHLKRDDKLNAEAAKVRTTGGAQS